MGELGWIGLVRIRNKTGRPFSSAPQNTQNTDVQGTSAEKQWAGIPGEWTYYSLGSSEFVVSNYSYTWQKILTEAIDCKNAVKTSSRHALWGDAVLGINCDELNRFRDNNKTYQGRTALIAATETKKCIAGMLPTTMRCGFSERKQNSSHHHVKLSGVKGHRGVVVKTNPVVKDFTCSHLPPSHFGNSSTTCAKSINWSCIIPRASS